MKNKTSKVALISIMIFMMSTVMAFAEEVDIDQVNADKYGALTLIPPLVAIILAFAFMAAVVIVYFRKIIPSSAIVLAAGADIICTIGIMNLLGITLSTAGIVSLLMLIGYAVDSNILLSTKILKRKIGTVSERIESSLKTGLTMQLTTMIKEGRWTEKI